MRKKGSKIAIVLACAVVGVVFFGSKAKMDTNASIVRTEDCDITARHEVSVMSQNVRVTAFEDGWDNLVFKRYNRLEELCNKYNADIKCFQEADAGWRMKLNAMFKEKDYFHDYYKNSKGLANPIYVKKSKFNILDSGNFILSQAYERDGEKYEDRIATWVKVEDKTTGDTLTMVNTHLAFHQDVQIQSCNKLMDFVKKANTDSYLITGDFNFDKNASSRYQIMTSNSTKDMALAATKEGKTGVMTYTNHGFGKANKYKRIDFFFGSKSLTSKMYTVLNDLAKGEYISDHYGILTYIDINK
ncbi:MAG: hypothetical protein E7262_04105 [Lachnospiraceae bacterium]|nr:hypothetical protein [Lachnospiraceae bacterium]